MKLATVKWFDSRKNNFGFLIPDETGPDIFLHLNAVPPSIVDNLQEGTRVRVRIEADKNGRPRATYVELAPAFDS
jgi:cold shock protein